MISHLTPSKHFTERKEIIDATQEHRGEELLQVVLRTPIIN
ncbi:hypothetical protein [Metabacillus fastidiosus]|nr:hypothetical protein [Metabacillus fastidiosus]MED4464748.1 hypothetical protein [Metabacillus fastidiosus]